MYRTGSIAIMAPNKDKVMEFDEMRNLEIESLITDPTNGVPVLLLKDIDSGFVLPIWIGQAEAMAIAMELNDKQFPRPLTHDLIKIVINSTGGSLKKVIISDLKESTYYASLICEGSDGAEFSVDARPSDSVALAIRTGTPLWVKEEVFQSSAIEADFDTSREDKESFERFIDKELDIKDFKKFT